MQQELLVDFPRLRQERLGATTQRHMTRGVGRETMQIASTHSTQTLGAVHAASSGGPHALDLDRWDYQQTPLICSLGQLGGRQSSSVAVALQFDTAIGMFGIHFICTPAPGLGLSPCCCRGAAVGARGFSAPGTAGGSGCEVGSPPAGSGGCRAAWAPSLGCWSPARWTGSLRAPTSRASPAPPRPPRTAPAPPGAARPRAAPRRSRRRS